VTHSAHSIVDRLGVGEGAVAALVSEHPDTGQNGTLGYYLIYLFIIIIYYYLLFKFK
jgi:hypothetical protein